VLWFFKLEPLSVSVSTLAEFELSSVATLSYTGNCLAVNPEVELKKGG